MPYSGTGKHKYSFQRIEVPSLPIHFCDCEEHSGSSEIAKVKQISDIEEQAGNVNKEELDMMRSVMNKIFKREDKLCTEHTNALPFDGVSPTKSSDCVSPIEREDDVPISEAESDQDNDIDNLVINMVNGGHTKSGLMENGSLENVIQVCYLMLVYKTNASRFPKMENVIRTASLILASSMFFFPSRSHILEKTRFLMLVQHRV